MATPADQARAFWIASPGRGDIRTERLPPVSAGDVVVRTLFSGISRGTEALVFEGRVPPSEYERMRAPFQAGDFPGPIKFGYANVGVVEEGPQALRGRHVFTLYPHQTRFVVAADAVCVVPDDVPPQRAVLAANAETAVNGVWDGCPMVGDRVTVIGGGTVGCLVAFLVSRIAGAEVELVDINPRRAPIARAYGVRFSAPDAATMDADLVFHCSATPSGLDLALQVAGREATIVEMSWYGEGRVPISLGGRFHSERLRLQSSQVSAVPAGRRARWDSRRRMRLALSLLSDPVLDGLITGESAFDDLPSVMAQLARSPGDTLCHRIRY